MNYHDLFPIRHCFLQSVQLYRSPLLEYQVSCTFHTTQFLLLLAEYVLQYHLYLVALDRYLTEKDPEYSYEKKFGGVFYVFLRGLGGSGENGVYYHRPEESIIRRISTALSEHI